MVIGLLCIAAIPTVTGVGNAISAQKQQNAHMSKEQLKFNMGIEMARSGRMEEVGIGVLADNKLFLDIAEDPATGFTFNGWYFKYPSEEGHLGLVSMVSQDPPTLNWIYVNADTHAVEYGGRKDTLGHVIGPWGWTDDDEFLTLQGEHETFVAVRREEDGKWTAYWDPDGRIAKETTPPERCRPVRLRRKMQRGVESRYVRGS